jgi:hypothetical protein
MIDGTEINHYSNAQLFNGSKMEILKNEDGSNTFINLDHVVFYTEWVQ